MLENVTLSWRQLVLVGLLTSTQFNYYSLCVFGCVVFVSIATFVTL